MKKVAIVTGASRGIGEATVKLLTKPEHDFAVCINYLKGEQEAQSIVDTIKKQGGVALAIKADISSENDVNKLFKTASELGPITALVNNAATTGGVCSVEDITLNCLQSVFNTNVFGTIFCCREAVKYMKKNNLGGSIVNISSEAARFGGNRLAHYAASKAAINAFTVGFAREIAQFNMRVNAVSPGVINTEMHAKSAPEKIQTLKSMIPMGRMGTANEVAEAVAWLLSDKSSYLTGAIIPVSGGR